MAAVRDYISIHWTNRYAALELQTWINSVGLPFQVSQPAEAAKIFAFGAAVATRAWRIVPIAMQHFRGI